MPNDAPMIIGEFQRTLDERYRLSIPAELLAAWSGTGDENVDFVLVKERRGCLSLWDAPGWRERWEAGVELIRQKIRLGRLEGELSAVQRFGRLLSSRYRPVSITQRGRLLIPEGFREFLGVEAGGNVMVVGAAVCIEIWHPDRWRHYLERQMPKFSALFQHLSQ